METFKSQQEELTPDELRILHALNLGYGNFVENAQRAGLYKNTYRYILKRGSGNRKNINKIRATLLKRTPHEDHSPQPGQDTTAATAGAAGDRTPPPLGKLGPAHDPSNTQERDN